MIRKRMAGRRQNAHSFYPDAPEPVRPHGLVSRRFVAGDLVQTVADCHDVEGQVLIYEGEVGVVVHYDEFGYPVVNFKGHFRTMAEDDLVGVEAIRRLK